MIPFKVFERFLVLRYDHADAECWLDVAHLFSEIDELWHQTRYEQVSYRRVYRPEVRVSESADGFTNYVPVYVNHTWICTEDKFTEARKNKDICML